MSPTVPVLDVPAAVPVAGIADPALRLSGVNAVLSTFVQSVESSSRHATSFVQKGLFNSTVDTGGGVVTNDYETDLDQPLPPDGHPNNQAETVADILAVFGAMFVAGVAIILISVYISKVRKRQSNVPSTRDAEAPLPNSANSDGMRSSVNGSVSSLSENSIEHGSTVHLGKEDELTIDFGSKPGLWRKTMRSVILRLRGQEQHKDVYVMPAHLRSQLKQMYVY